MGKIKKRIKEKLYNILPSYIADEFYQYKNMGFSNVSFSQEGEDMVIERFFNKKQKGFYIDVGAHHPIRYSNTYKFYKKGWRGINIDAMPGSMDLFNKLRPNDINLEYAISDTPQKMTFYIFNGAELNTLSKEEADYRNNKNEFVGCHIIDTKEIETYTLSEVLDKHFPKKECIDFMSIDVEGLDFAVLKSNNWSKYKPKMILIEALNDRFDLRNLKENNIYDYLTTLNYKLVAKTYNTLFFLETEL